tara:strand:- start:52 stop:273 length:222 start_codon:yes stop_codon:yes gene_type:complete
LRFSPDDDDDDDAIIAFIIIEHRRRRDETLPLGADTTTKQHRLSMQMTVKRVDERKRDAAKDDFLLTTFIKIG